MALIKCPECGKEIAQSAKACPSCGAPSKIQQEISKTKALFLGGVGLLMMIPAVAVVGIILVFIFSYVFN